MVEFVTLSAFLYIVWRRTNINGLFLLGFMVQTHWKRIATYEFIWIMMSLSPKMYHLGFDFTFEFPWLGTTEQRSEWCEQIYGSP